MAKKKKKLPKKSADTRDSKSIVVNNNISVEVGSSMGGSGNEADRALANLRKPMKTGRP